MKARIDSLWGPGYSATEKLRIFDSVWTLIDQKFACFQNLNLDWNAMREKYRPEITHGVSRGRFGAILNHLGISLKEPHTSFYDLNVSNRTKSAPGVPLLGGSLFGAALTPLPDSSLLVVQAINQDPLGLSPGDVVLGYDGLPWKQLYRKLLEMELPSKGTFAGGNEAAFTYHWLAGAGNNWHLFDTIDIVKYPNDDTVHLPTSSLGTLDTLLRGRQSPGVQIPIPGVPFPDSIGGPSTSVRWGIVNGTNIGYVYVWSWFHDSSNSGFYNALDSLIRIFDVTGLILDFRVNKGGYVSYADRGLRLLFKSNLPTLFLAQRADPLDHLAMQLAISYAFSDDSTRFYDKPIAVLTGPYCVSACDFISLRMKNHPRARFFGLTTASGYSSPEFAAIDTSLHIWYAFYNGFENETSPHYLTHEEFLVNEKIWHTRDATAKGEDAVVNAALSWIKSLTGVVAESAPYIPENFILEQNYPNPFNLTTNIVYRVPKNSHVTLSVFDVLGREVKVLVKKEQPAGSYSVKFDAVEISSGIYLYSLRSGSFMAVKKLIFLK